MVNRPVSNWLWGVAVVPVVAAVVTTVLAPDPSGHWSEHLSSAGFKTAQLVLLVVLVAMLGWRTLGTRLLIAFAVVAVGIGFQVIGDYQVAESIWGRTGDPGFGVGYTEGHDRSALGDLLVMVGGLAFAIIAGVTRRVPAWLAVVTGVMVIIPPPFLWPAAGVLVLVLYGLTRASAFAAGSEPPVKVSVRPAEA